jgi:hypothetical protein
MELRGGVVREQGGNQRCQAGHSISGYADNCRQKKSSDLILTRRQPRHSKATLLRNSFSEDASLVGMEEGSYTSSRA